MKLGTHLEIFKGEGSFQPWRFRMVGGNGEVISQSEGYFSKWNARRGARKTAERLDIPVVDKTTKPYRKFP